MKNNHATQRSLKLLREGGWTSQVVEKWNHYAHIRQDLFGCIDIVSIRYDRFLGVQSAVASGRSAHEKKLLMEPRARLWVQAGAELWLISWGKQKIKRGGVAFRWIPRVDIFRESDFEGQTGVARFDKDVVSEPRVPCFPTELRACGSSGE